MSRTCCPGIAKSRASIASIIVCGPLPLHIMFSFSAQTEDACPELAKWMVDLPCVFVQSIYKASQSFPSSATMNSIGGPDLGTDIVFTY